MPRSQDTVDALHRLRLRQVDILDSLGTLDQVDTLHRILDTLRNVVGTSRNQLDTLRNLLDTLRNQLDMLDTLRNLLDTLRLLDMLHSQVDRLVDTLSLLDTLHNQVDTPRSLLDTLSLLDALHNQVDTLHSLLDTVRSLLETLHNQVDTLHNLLDTPRRLLDTPRSLLDTLHSLLDTLDLQVHTTESDTVRSLGEIWGSQVMLFRMLAHSQHSRPRTGVVLTQRTSQLLPRVGTFSNCCEYSMGFLSFLFFRSSVVSFKVPLDLDRHVTIENNYTHFGCDSDNIYQLR